MKKIEAVLFDVIGTTVREKDPNTIINSLKLAFEMYGVIPNDEVITANRGKDKMEMINIILQNGNHPMELAPAIFESFKENVSNSLHNFEPAENVEEVFAAMANMGVKIGLGSGLPADLFDKFLDHLQWSKNNFHYIGISSEIGKARPDPAMIFDMIKSLGITDKSQLLKVGDTVADVEEGKNAGVPTVAVLSGTQPEDKLRATNPNFFAEKISDVVGIVESLA